MAWSVRPLGRRWIDPGDRSRHTSNISLRKIRSSDTAVWDGRSVDSSIRPLCCIFLTKMFFFWLIFLLNVYKFIEVRCSHYNTVMEPFLVFTAGAGRKSDIWDASLSYVSLGFTRIESCFAIKCSGGIAQDPVADLLEMLDRKNIEIHKFFLSFILLYCYFYWLRWGIRTQNEQWTCTK